MTTIMPVDAGASRTEGVQDVADVDSQLTQYIEQVQKSHTHAHGAVRAPWLDCESGLVLLSYLSGFWDPHGTHPTIPSVLFPRLGEGAI